MDKDKIKDLLYFYSPWWIQERVPAELILQYRRPIIGKLINYLDLNRILIIKGPRRTGKSTLLYQMIEYLITKRGISPYNIVYLSFDDPELRQDIGEFISGYEQIVGKSIQEQQQVYFFLDEVHFLENWEFMVKKFFDRKYPIKFIVSGSSASLIRKSTESLAGRTIEETILPFSFSEFVDYSLKDEKLRNLISQIKKEFSFWSLPDITKLIPYQRKLEIIFNKYLHQGGFPHIFLVKEESIRYKLLREDITEKVIYRDLVEFFGVKKPYVLEKLFLYLAEHSSEILNIFNISNSLNLSREYVEKYIDYLKQALLIIKLNKFAFSIEKQIRSNEKVYMIDPALIRLAGKTVESKLAESSVARHLWERKPCYWREKEEVDFVIEFEKKILPIEVKYSYSVSKVDLKGLNTFFQKFKVRNGIVITRDLLKKEKFATGNLLYIPCWLFLLLSDSTK